MGFDPHPLGAIGVVATAPVSPTAGTSLTLQTGHGARFNTGGFNCIVCPHDTLPDPTNDETIRISPAGVAGDVLTIVRQQEGSSARSIQVGDIVFASIGPKVLTDIEARTNPVGVEQMYPVSTPPSGWLLEDGSAVSRATYADLFALLVQSKTVTTPLATPGVVNCVAHGRTVGDPVFFTVAGGSLPGITASTTYYVSVVPDADHLQISATLGGGSIAFTGTTSGTQTMTYAPWGIGDGSTTFNVPDRRNRFPVGADPTAAHGTAITAGQSAAAATHVHGSSVLAIATHTHTVGDHTHTVGVHFHAAGSHTHPVSSHQHSLSDPNAYGWMGVLATGVYINRTTNSIGQALAASAKFTATGEAVASSTTGFVGHVLGGATDATTPTTSASAGNTGNSGTFSTTTIDGGAPQTGNNSLGGVSGNTDPQTAPYPPWAATYFIIKT